MKLKLTLLIWMVLSYSSIGYSQSVVKPDRELYQPPESPKVFANLLWTEDELIAQIEREPEKVIYIHWRWKRVGNNQQGDAFVNKILTDLPEVDKIFVIELFMHTHTNTWKSLVKVPGKYNRKLGKIEEVPVGSFIVNKQELRYRNPNVERGFYDTAIEKARRWIAARKKEIQ